MIMIMSTIMSGKAIDLDFIVNPIHIVQVDAAFVMVTIIVVIIQMKINKSVTVVSKHFIVLRKSFCELKHDVTLY